MKNLPATKSALALRTDFSNEPAWRNLCAAITAPAGEFSADVEFVSDPEFSGLTPAQLVAAPSEEPDRPYAFLIDHTALMHPDHPILVVDLLDEPGRTFRVIPAETWSIENNLSLGNMAFAEFAEAVDSEGVFRGFP